MPENNLSLVLHGINDMRFEERPVPKPGHDQVLIRVGSVGICGTDVHYLKHMACGKIVIKEPFVLGHETAGVIAELGEGVTDFKVGDRVSLAPGVPCRRCTLCKDGRCNLCRQGAVEKFFYAAPPYDGSLRRYVIHDADLCVKLPDHVTMDEGALLEPLACAAHACYRAGITVSQNVLVLGAGPIGSLVMLTSRAYGVSKVVITDIDQARLDEAKKLGADAAINVRGKAVADVREEIIAAFGGVEPDVSLDCTGVASSVETGILTTKTGGVVALVGLGQARSEVPLLDAACREIEIRGVLRYKDLKTALELVSTKKVDLTKLCAAHYKLEEGLDAFARFDKADVVKIFIHCD